MHFFASLCVIVVGLIYSARPNPAPGKFLRTPELGSRLGGLPFSESSFSLLGPLPVGNGLQSSAVEEIARLVRPLVVIPARETLEAQLSVYRCQPAARPPLPADCFLIGPCTIFVYFLVVGCCCGRVVIKDDDQMCSGDSWPRRAPAG